ncbi:Pentafunctional AROM polypeptide [Sphaceloma murrayae]|uniref:Pentafunctional AROM polypeptide n=1 Tax=Sphaceloma murrayae TaxID=2082308 RepID=A0A2K1QGY6_9PEZI|nr:Pentafunctional AROM polypeptide [Sphaceloma murrayae]
MTAARKRSFHEYTHDARDTGSKAASLAHINGSRHAGGGVVETVTTSTGVNPDATIVLIGNRGTGKSSLAFLAASAYNRRLVEFERYFEERTGQTLSAQRQSEKGRAGRKQRQEVLASVFRDHDSGAVIICEVNDLEYGSSLLAAFAASHPVIYINRDVEGIHEYMGTWDKDKLSHLATSTAHLLRECTTFEYFNWTETGKETGSSQSVSAHLNGATQQLDNVQSLPSLRLKRTERDFLKFLRLVLGDRSRTPSHQSAYPLSDLPLRSRKHTYACSISVEEVLEHSIDLEIFQTGADAFILRLPTLPLGKAQRHQQYTRIAHAFSIVRRFTILPIIIDPSVDKTSSHDDHAWRFCCRLAPEGLVVHLDVLSALSVSSTKAPKLPKLIAKVDVDDYDALWQDPSLQTAYQLASRRTCDMVMMISHATDYATVISLEAFRFSVSRKQVADPSLPYLSAFNRSLQGRYSQITNPGLLPVRGANQYGSQSQDSAPALTAKDATQAMFASFMQSPLRFCIIGANVDFSLSPAMHNEAYQALGMPHHYTTRSTQTLDVLDELMQDQFFGGTAVTQPYKISVVGKLKSLSRHARVIRAVNTIMPVRRNYVEGQQINDVDIVVTRNESGPILALHGDNSDWIGMRACLRRGLSPVNAVRKTSSGLIIGAGGMARAAVYSMIHMGVQNIFICNRTRSRAEELAAYYNDWLRTRESGTDEQTTRAEVHVLDSLGSKWPEAFRLPTMIVSSVPAESVDGRLEANFTLPEAWLASPSGGVVVDLTYNPLVTALVRQIKGQTQRGWVIMTGLDMLPEQAFAQFELFTGRRAPRHVMREEVLKAFRSQQARS